MNKNEITEATIAIYTELFKQVTLNRNYVYKRISVQDTSIVEKFSDWLLSKYLPEQVGIVFLIDYFKFQFSRYAGIKTTYGVNAIMLSWLIGKKAQKEWNDQLHSKRWMVKFKLSKTIEINLIQTFQERFEKEKNKERIEEANKIYRYEEVEKNRFFNTRKGFVYCQTTTTLYKAKSKFCSTCQFKKYCIESLKGQFPKLHKLRMND